jgi:mRNA interferase RelE/StbE
LTTHCNVRAAGQRYRVLYQLQNEEVNILVLFIGRRDEGSPRDIYQLAPRLVKLGLPQTGD